MCEYSEIYRDDLYEYRHVFIPKEVREKLPKQPRILTEQEWRGAGIQMSLGWENYMVNPVDRNLLLFRRTPKTPLQASEGKTGISGVTDSKLPEIPVSPLKELSPRVFCMYSDRRKIVSYMIESGYSCNTTYVGVYILEKFLSKKGNHIEVDRKVLADTCMFIACKMTQVSVPEVSEFGSGKDIVDLEKIILKTINFCVIHVTPVHFIRKLSEPFSLTELQQETIRCLLRISMLDNSLYFAKAIAEACMLLVGVPITPTKISKGYAELLKVAYDEELKTPGYSVTQLIKNLSESDLTPMNCAVTDTEPVESYDHICTTPSKNLPPEYTRQYRRISKVGEGTYGIVYRVQTRDGNVVMKKFKHPYSDETGVEFTVIRELSVLQQLPHPNIVRLEGIGMDDTDIRAFLEPMDLDLSSYLDSYKVDLDTVRKLLFDILKGVEHLHRNNIWHRDLKPCNILISTKPEPVAKLGDLGLNCFQVGKGERTPKVCTVNFRPPELLLGMKKYGSHIDIWSVACIFAQMVTKKFLFTSCSEIDTLLQIFQLVGTPSEANWPEGMKLPIFSESFPKWKPADLSKVVPGLDMEGLDLLGKMLTIDPDKRITASQALRHPFFKQS